MNIALLGFGTVCKGVYEILKEMPEYNIKRILIRNPDKKYMDSMTLSFDDIENDHTIDLVVEAIGGLHPAKEYILASLKAKKHVVTANKAVVAKYFDEFISVAKENNVKFMVEATSGGGIPWIKNLQRVSRIDDVSSLYGIMNGTSNYILSAMTNENKDFDDVLKIAQELGYAESDPSADIDGDDIRNKCAISASIAFKSLVCVDNINQFGIRNITKADINWFQNQNLVCKLFANAIKENNCYDAVVEPVLLNKNTIEANVSQNYNITHLFGKTIGEIKLFGQGAGGLPTGNAIVQDIIDIKENQAFDISLNKTLSKANIISGKYYIRTSSIDSKIIPNNIIEYKDETHSNTIIITKEILSSDIHKIIHQNPDKKFFIARFI